MPGELLKGDHLWVQTQDATALRVVTQLRDGTEKPFEAPVSCPDCRGPLIEVSEASYGRCANGHTCRSRVHARLLHLFVSDDEFRRHLEGWRFAPGPVISDLIDRQEIVDGRELFHLTTAQVEGALRKETEARWGPGLAGGFFRALSFLTSCGYREAMSRVLPWSMSGPADVVTAAFESLNEAAAATIADMRARGIPPDIADELATFLEPSWRREILAAWEAGGLRLSGAPDEREAANSAAKNYLKWHRPRVRPESRR